MGPERLSVYHKDHIAVDALFQKTGKSQKGCIIQATAGSPRPLSTPTHLNPLRVRGKPTSAPSFAPSSPLQEIVIVISPSAGCSDLLIVS